MPEEQCAVDLGSILDNLDDFTLSTTNYNEIQRVLQTEKPIKCSDAEKLVSICLQDINEENEKYSINSLNILSFLLNKIKKEQCSPTTNLVSSAQGILSTLKTVSFLQNIESLRLLCFEILLTYPNETLISLAVEHSSEIYEIVELYCNSQAPTEVILQPTFLILRLLKIMTHNDKVNFVKNGLDTWFSSLIPTIFNSSMIYVHIVENALLCLELLTEDLVHFDYADNSKWLIILECIYMPHKYPLVMKRLLEDGSDHWHRLWMVCVKLLKNQITKNINSAVACPINSMLPVVEAAFKMDVKNRCQAFQCWNVLIDNFSSEANEVYMNKRIKLLLIPLVSNNAKVEETALAKFDTWWHFIVKFHTIMPQFSDTVLLPFLQFCFGKPVVSNKPTIIPGLLSEETKKLTLQCFANIFAHYNCTGCVDMPKLENKLITTTHLVTNWKHWLNALSVVIKIGSDSGDKILIKQTKCAWKSFVAIVGELPENNVRKDFFIELLAMLQKSLQDCQAQTSEIVINVLLPALFEEDEHIKPLLKMNSEQGATILKIFSILSDQSNNNFYSRCDVDETITCVRSSTDYLIQVSIKTSTFIMESIIKDLPTTESSLILWTAIVESILKFEFNVCVRVLFNMVLWPLKMNLQSNVNRYISTWQTMYDYVSTKVTTTSINDEILQFFAANKGTNTIFSLIAIVAMVGQVLVKDKDMKFEKKIELILKHLQKQVDNHKHIQPVYMQLLQHVALILNRLTNTASVACAKHLFLIINKILKFTPNIINEDIKEKKHIFTCLEKVITSIDLIFKMDAYSKLNMLIFEGIKESAPVLIKNMENKIDVISILNTYENKDSDIKQLVENLTVKEKKSEENKLAIHSFTTPNNRQTTKKTTKKELSIVNTIVENGEEFVVVKSNWKFNPKKLTDNQKEKLQRKREDIPALYQDLSQSQDEFKLNAWKSESNDANSSSKSTSVSTCEDVPTVLRNIPNQDITPKIMENISKCDGNNPIADEKNNLENIITIPKESTPNTLQPSLTKDTKSPRMALKDRVFRNVRNLIEKSNLNEENGATASISENGSKTPLGAKITVKANIINSAPSQLNCSRPSRNKRPPKKFDDSEIFSIKRRRPSLGQQDAEESDQIISSDETNKVNNDKPSINRILPADIQIEKSDITLKLDSKDADNATKTLQKIEEQSAIESTIEKSHIDESKMLINNNLLNSNDHNVEETIDTDASTPKVDISTPSETKVTDMKNDISTPKSSTRKPLSKKSRIEKELAIDMVEGHPFLNAKSEKRLTRKAISNSPSTRKKTTANSNSKTKSDELKVQKEDSQSKNDKTNISLDETQSENIDITASQDIIESSQDSSVTTISVRSTKNSSKKGPIVILDQINNSDNTDAKNQDDMNVFLQSKKLGKLEKGNDLTNSNDRDDTVLPQNKTAEEQSTIIDLTENMDTEPMEINDDDICGISDKQIVEIKNDELCMDVDSQGVASADTQPLDPNFVLDTDETAVKGTPEICLNNNADNSNILVPNGMMSDISIYTVTDNDATNASITTSNETTKTITELTVCKSSQEEAASSPLKDDEQRKKDFLNNILEISPIKILSPVRDERTPSPETSNDYVVIKLCSPVHCNGEPIEKCNSPEIFTEDKVSPDKRDLSPPREEITATNTSPSSLSLKKNRPQVRSGGRGAQMLGLCVPDRLQKINTSEKMADCDEIKKATPINTTARRNLRILYNTTESLEATDDNEDSDNFLKFKRNLPTTDCSPSGPILKRKLADIADEATPSPVSKRKRVSFHDPPVSTTVCVKKYIEPCGVRSPQNSASKRQERQLRIQNQTPKSQRRLDKALTKTIESFVTENSSEDTQMSSIEPTPVIEVVKTSDLNDTDPICPELINCKDSIENIATELSSPAMKSLLVKEFEGKIETIGDLAKMTELEVNRLCIKAPKVQTVKNVLCTYMPKKDANIPDSVIIADEEAIVNTEDDLKTPNSEIVDVMPEKRSIVSDSVEIQTDMLDVSSNSTQTNIMEQLDSCIQTDMGTLIYETDIPSHLNERHGILEKLDDKVFETLTDTFVERLPLGKSCHIIDKIVQRHCENDTDSSEDKRFSFLQQYLFDKFETRDLMLFCSGLLKKVYDKC
ncbi:telomere-associated protein RIF1 [Zerene cesonia]|uniref:telomere-associated protein RIF1 n=1 Tax=Zerene cesonia TaxID=33412 RepID=UPI0018E525E2|nr:telomere-associated protein RIF1 [Zerene cesonia]